MQLGLAGAVAAHGVDVHAGREHIGGEDGGVGLVGRHGGHDVGAAHGLGRAGAGHCAQACALQIGLQLGGGGRVGVEQSQRGDAQQVVKRQRLELALRAVANQRHGAAARPRQGAGGHGRHGGGAQRGGEGELAQQQRRARGHIGQHAKRHHGGQTPACVLGVAVDVLERIGLTVGNGHEFDHAVARVAGHPR